METNKIVNLTGRDIVYYPSKYTDLQIPVQRSDVDKFKSRCSVLKSAGEARVQLSRIDTGIKGENGNTKDINIFQAVLGVVSGLPDEQEGTIYILNYIAYNAVSAIRKDVYCMDRPVRDYNGATIACRGFSRNVFPSRKKALEPVLKYIKERISYAPADSKEYERVLEILVNLEKLD